MKESNTLRNKVTKRYLSANGSLLLPLALKWRLVHYWVAGVALAVLVLPCIMGRSVSAASITLTIPGRLSFIAATDGQFHESAAATVSVKSDAYAGYTLGIKGSENTSPALKNGSYTIASISSAMAGSSFPVNTWGWLPGKLNGQANTLYQPGPTTTFVTLDETDSANPSTNNDYIFKLGAKLDNSKPAGAYVNTFTFTVTAKPVPYNISYNTSGGSTVDATKGEAAEGTQITLASAPTRTYYEFKGWCTVTTSDETCPSSGTSYEAGGKYTLTNSANSITLYAMWKLKGTQYSITYNLTGGTEGGPSPNPQEGITMGSSVSLDRNRPRKSGYTFLYWCSADNTADPTTCPGDRYSYDIGEYNSASYSLYEGAVTTFYAVWRKNVDLGTLGDMQSFSCSMISNMGDYGTVRDTRDGNTYRVRLLADGRCWMIDNFRLGDSKLTNRTLTSANTDLNGIASYKLPDSSAEGFTSYAGDTNDLAENMYAVEADSPGDRAGDVLKIYGGYYTYNVAVAGTGPDLTSSSLTDAPSSICPKGWKLPVNGFHSVFWRLEAALGYGSGEGTAHMTDPDGPNFLPSGQYYNSRADDQGNKGYYWTPTTSGRYVKCIGIGINDSSLSDTYTFRAHGNSIRCVAQSPTMQTVNQWSSNVKAGGTAIAIDERDGNSYRVRRLADGKLWMVDNLRLGDSDLTNKTLTSANTDLNGKTSYVLPDSGSGFNRDVYTTEGVVVSAIEWTGELYVSSGYYTWNAATAGTGASVTADGANASSSICPKGWKLPTNADFSGLNKAMGGITNNDTHLRNPDGPNLLPGGYRLDARSYRYTRNRGFYWSSTSHDSTDAYSLTFDKSSVEVTNTNAYDSNRSYGLPVRCVQR